MSTGPERETLAGVWVTVHLRSGVELGSTVYADEDRVVLQVAGTNTTRVSLFAGRADLDRLHAVVTAARDQLAATTTTSTTDPPSADAADAA